MRSLTLLGPQRLKPTLAPVFDRLEVTGQVAAITAGWQEREAEVEEMREHLGRPVVDLMLHRRCDEVFAAEPELFRAHRARQDQLREMQKLYRYRLDFTIQPARELLGRGGDSELLKLETKAAIEALRRLDKEHLARIAEVHRAFHKHLATKRYPALEKQKDQIREILDGSSALAIAGGHVAVLLNRMRLCGITDDGVSNGSGGKGSGGSGTKDLPIVAWSAGAMVLAHRIVLFHDSPPQGAGNAEILEQGLGLFDDLQPLPHAHRRLRLDDPCRVELFARRFAPARCVPLDEGASLTRVDSQWQADTPMTFLAPDGSVTDLGEAA